MAFLTSETPVFRPLFALTFRRVLAAIWQRPARPDPQTLMAAGARREAARRAVDNLLR